MMIDILVRAPARPQPAASQVWEHAAPVVLFRLGHQRYGLLLTVVREIVRLPDLTLLAGAPPMLCGLLNLRGRHLPVLDGRVLVGEPTHYDLSSQVVIAGREQPELGLLVDQVQDVSTIAADLVGPIGQADVAPLLTSVCNLADGSALLFDLSALLALAHEGTRQKTKRAARRREPR